MTFYGEMADTARELIAEFGQPVTLEKPGVMTGPDHDQRAGTPTTHSMTVVDLNVRVRDNAGVLVEGAGRTLYATADIAPAKQDRVLIGGRWHEIAEVRPLAPAGEVVMYEVDLVR